MSDEKSNLKPVENKENDSSQEAEIPNELPILPLRNTVAFP